MLIRRSAKMLAENVDCAWPGFKKEFGSQKKQLLNLRCHRITMVQATESRKGLNLVFARRANFCRPTCWRVLRESKMSPVLMVVEHVGGHQPFEMPLIQDDHERSQRNPEQFVQGSQSTARLLRVQSQQLPTESQVLEDEVLTGTESADQPAEEMSERHDHGKNSSGKI
jgi:hypothetical protein